MPLFLWHITIESDNFDSCVLLVFTYHALAHVTLCSLRRRTIYYGHFR